MEMLKQPDRVNRLIMDMVKNVGMTQGLSGEVHVMVKDIVTEQTFGSFVVIVPSQLEAVPWGFHRGTIGMLRPTSTIQSVAESLIVRHPGVPIVCSETFAQKLTDESSPFITLVTEGHYTLAGTAKGTIDVYTPVAAIPLVSNGPLPPGISGGQIFLERP